MLVVVVFVMVVVVVDVVVVSLVVVLFVVYWCIRGVVFVGLRIVVVYWCSGVRCRLPAATATSTSPAAWSSFPAMGALTASVEAAV